MASELDKFIQELRSGTSVVEKKLIAEGEMGEAMLELLKSAAEIIARNEEKEKAEQCH